MRRFLLWLLVLLLLAGCFARPEGKESFKEAPAFRQPLLGGGELNFPADCRGKVTLLIFFSPNCPACVQELIALRDQFSSWEGQGVKIFLVAPEPPSVLTSFLQEYNLKVPVVLDPQGTVGSAYGVTGIPLSVWVDKQGRIKYKSLGWRAGKEKEFASWVAKLTQE
ncbi:peroxiredoxin family protein [Ammonifex thiophilus]|uniref:peroxiredoxin family protein n=1 Tax=Ammonifex thiophilus TaxID=444093 RepID=UPI001401BEAE|nr:TlpA disulfide reductase family protein [Ammonifex thiophilus]